MYYAGIDIGSLSADTVIVDEQGVMAAYTILPTGANSKVSGEKCFNETLEKAGITKQDIRYIVATGYGRISVPFADKAITEITCHGRGAYALFPNTRTIIDIGGQDSKVIKLENGGKVIDFAMNDKCAAGTGRFLEVMARAMEVKLQDMGPLSFQAKNKVEISSMCTVFAESEVISLVAQAQPKEDIIAGIHAAICSRVGGMIDRVGLVPEVTMTGGVAKNTGMVASLEKRTGVKINIPEEPQIAGALGAALIARERAQQEKE